MNNQTELSDFTFKFISNGRYNVTYTSPYTGKKSSRIITNMSLIEATKNQVEPIQLHLNHLKSIVKYSILNPNFLNKY